MTFNHKTIQALYAKNILGGYPLSSKKLDRLQQADDPSAKQFISDYNKQSESNIKRVRRWKELSVIENRYWKKGHKFLVGVDEVGVAPLAGPVLAAAVVLPKGCRLLDVDDSKKISESERDRLAIEIKRVAIAWGVGKASPAEIDRLNIRQANLLAMRRAVRAVERKVAIEVALVDYHKIPKLDCPQDSITKGDQKSLSIAAASIIAKTTRDAMMRKYDTRYPGYDLSSNKGYGSQRHKAAILELGVLPIHRLTFGSVREALVNGIPVRSG